MGAFAWTPRVGLQAISLASRVYVDKYFRMVARHDEWFKRALFHWGNLSLRRQFALFNNPNYTLHNVARNEHDSINTYRAAVGTRHVYILLALVIL